MGKHCRAVFLVVQPRSGLKEALKAPGVMKLKKKQVEPS